MLRRDDNPQKKSRFWCSALVGYIYTECGCLHPGTDWSMIRPSDFVENYLQYINDVELIIFSFTVLFPTLTPAPTSTMPT